MLFCGDLLRFVGVTSVRQLFGGFSFGCFLVVMLKCFHFCDRRAKEFKVLKHFMNTFVLFLIEKCVVQVS